MTDSTSRCASLLHMLLITGYHAGTSPKLFKNDVATLPKICTTKDAPYTTYVVGKNGFDVYRFKDMENMRTAITADLVRIVSPDLDTQLFFSS